MFAAIYSKDNKKQKLITILEEIEFASYSDNNGHFYLKLLLNMQ